MFVDSHCHLSYPELSADLDGVVARMRAAGVGTALTVCTTLEEFPTVHAIATRFEGVYASVGVHPDNQGVREPDVETLVALAAQPKVVAIGETGLDYYRLAEPLDWQRERFRTHIRAARRTGKPLIIHTRAAAADTLRLMREEGADVAGGVMHCFTESAEVARAALDLGFHISFSGIVTFKNAVELQQVAREIPADRLLIDLRDNPGGDNSFSDLMLAWFADKPFRFSEEFDIKVSAAATESNRKRLQGEGGETNSTSLRLAAAYDGKPLGSRISFPIPLALPREGVRFAGPVYLLVNRHSYSNTVLVAAIAQDYGFGKVLGEETADLASTYGAAEKFTLPLTGIEVTFPKARILRPNGNPQPRGVIPDIAIKTPVAAVDSDVVLEEAMRLVVRRQGKGR